MLDGCSTLEPQVLSADGGGNDGTIKAFAASRLWRLPRAAAAPDVSAKDMAQTSHSREAAAEVAEAGRHEISAAAELATSARGAADAEAQEEAPLLTTLELLYADLDMPTDLINWGVTYQQLGAHVDAVVSAEVAARCRRQISADPACLAIAGRMMGCDCHPRRYRRCRRRRATAVSIRTAKSGDEY